MSQRRAAAGPASRWAVAAMPVLCLALCACAGAAADALGEDKLQLIRAARLLPFFLIALLTPTLGLLDATAAPAAAPAASAPQFVRFKGIVTAINGAQVTMTGDDGASSHITIAADAWIIKGK